MVKKIVVSSWVEVKAIELFDRKNRTKAWGLTNSNTRSKYRRKAWELWEELGFPE